MRSGFAISWIQIDFLSFIERKSSARAPPPAAQMTNVFAELFSKSDRLTYNFRKTPIFGAIAWFSKRTNMYGGSRWVALRSPILRMLTAVIYQQALRWT
jgi:hypothetical protein